MMDYVVIGMWLQGLVGALVSIIYFRIKGIKKYSQINGIAYSILFGLITIPIYLLFVGNIFQNNELFSSILISSLSGFFGAQLGYLISYYLFKDVEKIN